MRLKFLTVYQKCNPVLDKIIKRSILLRKKKTIFVTVREGL
jgi:hypothetical protein